VACHSNGGRSGRLQKSLYAQLRGAGPHDSSVGFDIDQIRITDARAAFSPYIQPTFVIRIATTRLEVQNEAVRAYRSQLIRVDRKRITRRPFGA
jgi:hypothetical protein